MTTADEWNARVRATWNERAPSWDELSETNAAAPDREVDIGRTAAALRLHPGSVVLDAGCGTGQFAIAFARLGCRVTAVDLAPAMIERARRHGAEAGVAVTWRVGDVARLPEPLAVYDAIHARVVLQFVPDLPAALHEFRRVLKPGGRLYASVPGALSPIYSQSWRRLFPDADLGSNFIVPWELEEILRALGWAILDGWGEYGPSLTGEENALSPSEAERLPLRLRQAAATSWAIVAR